jgi:sulfur-oxidizing protein SoxY
MHVSRRRLLRAGAAGLAMRMSGAAVVAVVTCLTARTAVAASDDLASAIAGWAQGATVQPGRVKLDVSPLVDNGNVVPLTVSVDSPMTATDHVVAIAIFNEKNPQRDVARFTLGPRSGKAEVSTRIRLATSQQLVAVARMKDGTCWSHAMDVVVTLAACIEGDL